MDINAFSGKYTAHFGTLGKDPFVLVEWEKFLKTVPTYINMDALFLAVSELKRKPLITDFKDAVKTMKQAHEFCAVCERTGKVSWRNGGHWITAPCKCNDVDQSTRFDRVGRDNCYKVKSNELRDRIEFKRRNVDRPAEWMGLVEKFRKEQAEKEVSSEK